MLLRGLAGDPLDFDWKIVLVTISSTLLLMVDSYQRLTPVKGYDRLILYLITPLAIILLVFRERPQEYGFQIGDWKVGLLLTLFGALLIAPVLWLIGRGGTMHDYYQSQLAGLPWSTFIDLFGWEYLFRGFDLVAYYRFFGSHALF